MKKTSSFHLEEDILKEITDYQKLNNLGSRNIALERMILEIKNIKRELEDKTALAEYAKSILINGNIEHEVIIKDTKIDENIKSNNGENNIKKDGVRRSIKSAFESMPLGVENKDGNNE